MFPLEGYSTIDPKQAEEEGWFKVDFPNNHIYKDIIDEQHLDKLIATEPMWELLEHQRSCREIILINNHFDIVKQYKLQSLEQLAMILAIIRPAKGI